MATQGRSRRLREQEAQSQQQAAAPKPGKKAAPHLDHPLHVRLASCYCSQCRVGSHDGCLLAQREGVGGLVGQPQTTFVREVLAVAGGGGGGGGSGGGQKRKRAPAPPTPPADSQAETVAPTF